MNRTALDRLSLALVVIGALNWLLVGLFSFDVVAAIFGSSTALASKVIYSIIGIAGIYSSSLFFRETSTAKS